MTGKGIKVADASNVALKKILEAAEEMSSQAKILEESAERLRQFVVG